jgi:hypothetical protein
MSFLQDVLDALRTVVTPEIAALREKVDANQRETLLRFETMNREIGLRFDGINQRFDDLIERLDLRRRVEDLERERKAS